MVRDIVIVGAGGFGREVVWTLERINAGTETWRILGFADDDPAKAGKSFEGYPVLGTVARVAADHPGASVFIALGDNARREQLYTQLRGCDFARIVDPSAVVAPTIDLRHGVFIGPQAVVSVGVQIGKFALVNARTSLGHDCVLGDFAQICPGATLSGNTTVGDHAFIGSNASTCPGVRIGAHAKVAAGMPVFAHVADGETVSPFGAWKR